MGPHRGALPLAPATGDKGNPFTKILYGKSFVNFFNQFFYFFGQNFSSKKKVAKFFDKKTFDFFWNFFKRCLNKFSKGTKNNEEKISSSFREIWEILEKKVEKKGILDFGEIF